MPTANVNNRLLPFLRIAVMLQLIAVLLQGAFAGQMLSGTPWAYSAHQAGAGAIHALGAIQLIVAIVYWRPGRGPGWPALASLAILITGFVQSAIVGPGNLSVHVPLALGIAILITGVAVWTLTRTPIKTPSPAPA